MEVKICGITRLEDALAAAQAGADYVGLILAPGVRQVSSDTARDIAQRIPSAVTPVLVFRDASIEQLVGAVGETGVRTLQLHGREDVDFISRLNSWLPGARIIKAWEIGSMADVENLFDFLSACATGGIRLHRVVLDTPKGQGPPLEQADAAKSALFAAIIQRWRPEFPPLWRAGGLTLEKLADALREGAYAGVDVARGVESSPGRKDVNLIRRFVRVAREAAGPQGEKPADE